VLDLTSTWRPRGVLSRGSPSKTALRSASPGAAVGGGASTIELVVVDRRYRRTGVGRALIRTAIAVSRRRGATGVNIKPVARDDSAIQVFHDLGFRTLGRLQLFMSLDGNASYLQPGPDATGAHSTAERRAERQV